MNFHLPARTLSPNAPELWGCPRFSAHGAGWLLDWFDLRGSLEGVSIAQGGALEWINANPEAVATMQAQVAAWKIPF